MSKHEEFMRLYKEVTKEEYDSFIKNYFAKNHKNQSCIKGHYFMDWYCMFDFEVSETKPIVKSSPYGKYYILKEVFKDE